MIDKKTIRVKGILLEFIVNENLQYLDNCDIDFNSEKPKEIAKKYSARIDLRVLNSDFEKTKKNTESDDINENKLTFAKYIQEIGKEFIDMRKQDVGKNKIKSIKIDTSLSFIETINNMKTSSKRKSISFKFCHLNVSQLINDLFISKDEKEAKMIQENFNTLQKLVYNLKITGNPNNYRDNNNNFLKFNEELFDILEYKGLKINTKYLNSEEKNPFIKNKSNSEQKNKINNNILNLTNDDLKFNFNSIDNYDTNINTFNYSSNKRLDENYYNLEKTTSPIETRYNNYESNNGLEILCDLDIDNRASNLSMYDGDTPTNLKFKLDFGKSKKCINLVQCNKNGSIVKYDSEISKHSECTKSELSKYMSNSLSKSNSIITNSSISEVSNDFEFNDQNSCR